MLPKLDKYFDEKKKYIYTLKRFHFWDHLKSGLCGKGLNRCVMHLTFIDTELCINPLPDEKFQTLPN